MRLLTDILSVLYGLSHSDEVTLSGVYTCSEGGLKMQSQSEGVLIEGQGLVGDRYSLGTGFWHPVESCELTAITEDDLKLARKRGDLALSGGQHRRNLVLSGALPKLSVGQYLGLGEAVLAYQRPRPPCGYLDKVAGRGMAKMLGKQSGFCLKVIRGGRIKVGDRVHIR